MFNRRNWWIRRAKDSFQFSQSTGYLRAQLSAPCTRIPCSRHYTAVVKEKSGSERRDGNSFETRKLWWKFLNVHCIESMTKWIHIAHVIRKHMYQYVSSAIHKISIWLYPLYLDAIAFCASCIRKVFIKFNACIHHFTCHPDAVNKFTEQPMPQKKQF